MTSIALDLRCWTPVLAVSLLLKRLDAHFDAVALRRARNGATVLEREIPGSVASLDAERLDIRKGDTCALAQTYGHFQAAPDRLRRRCYGVWTFVFSPITYERLTKAWRQIIPEYRARWVASLA